MRLVVAGSRTFTDQARLFAELDRLALVRTITAIISGCAAGADQLGELWAAARRVPVVRFPAEWRKHGRAAGILRNQRMTCAADAADIFFGPGPCRGSRDMARRARAAGLPVFVFSQQPELFG